MTSIRTRSIEAAREIVRECLEHQLQFAVARDGAEWVITAIGEKEHAVAGG